jgi:phosphoribosyl 1,2-cyclic phosphodiesterase
MVELVVLGSGSRGNSTLIRTHDSSILIDAGLSARQLSLRLESVGHYPAAIEAIVLTHDHADHVCGIRVFTNKYQTALFGNEGTLHRARHHLGDPAAVETFHNSRSFTIGDFKITGFPVPHDAADPVGFLVEAEGVKIGYTTDLGHVSRTVLRRLAGSEIIVLESNHDTTMLREGPYPPYIKRRIDSPQGHLSNEHAAKALPKIAGPDTRHIVLAHLSQTNNLRRKALQSAKDALDQAGLNGIEVSAARQSRPLEPVVL